MRMKRAAMIMAGLLALGSRAARGQVDAVLQTPDGPVPVRWASCDPSGEQVKLSPGTAKQPDGGAPVFVELIDRPGSPRDAALEFDFPVNTNWQPVKAVQFWVRPEAALPEKGLSVRVYAGGRQAGQTRITDTTPGEWSPVTLTGKFRSTWDMGLDQHRCQITLADVAEDGPVAVRFHIDNLRFLTATEETRTEWIEKLKDLHLDTTLAGNGAPRAVIVAPAGDRYAAALRTVQAAVKACAGVLLPVRADTAAATRELLAESHVIALGNMASNRFIERLYCEYYTLTDLWYPGKGGHEVRSLHDPYGTGHNVIFLGGSDDAGVEEAARVFAAILKPGNPLTVGRLMEIKLGDALKPPAVGERVCSWLDSHRPGPQGKGYGYGPATVFGWNPISIAAAMYYMTGEPGWMERFVRLILPDPDNIPREFKKFKQPLKPLAEFGHYNMHLLALYWDLIEESPLLSDGQRLRITNALLEHQNEYDPNNTYRGGGGGRHSQWHMFTIYTGSRYFAKYYPHPRWAQRLTNARESFGSVVGRPTVGTDSPYWRNTVTQPIVDFCVLGGLDGLASSGTIRDMLSALEVLWKGGAYEESNRYQAIGMLRKAAYLLKDGRYLWLADAARYEPGVFRIGQSFAPPAELEPTPPTDLVGRISVFPPRRPSAAGQDGDSPAGRGFRFLSYRSGLGPKDDYLLLDGYYGASRTVYHVNALHTVRMGGTLLLNGDQNQIRVRRQGMVAPAVAKAAALETAVCSGSGLYVRSRVPDMPFSAWTRHILYLKDLYTIILDEIEAREPGRFDITCEWRGTGGNKLQSNDARCMRFTGGTTVACSVGARVRGEKGHVTQSWSQELAAREACALGNLVYPTGPGDAHATVDSVSGRLLRIGGDAPALACFGPYQAGETEVDADAAYLAPGTVFGANLRRLVWDGISVAGADQPATLLWRPAEGRVEVDTVAPVRLSLLVAEPAHVAAQTGDVHVSVRESMAQVDLPAGRHLLSNCRLPDPARRKLAAILERITPAEAAPAEPAAREAADPAPEWRPVWTAALEREVAHLAFSPHTRPGTIWTAGEQSLAATDIDGKALWREALASPARSLWAASSRAQAQAFGALVGGDDEQLHAFRADGTKAWTVKTERVPKPWPYTREKTGVLCLLAGNFWGNGHEQIALGRASTVELRGLDGELVKRVPVLYGDNTTLALLPKRPGPDAPPLLLAGQFFCGFPDLTVINEKGEPVTHEGYRWDFPRGVEKMTAWTQQGNSHLATADLDGDGADEVIAARSGHWNELDVYDRRGNCRWMHYFGPAASLSRFVCALEIADLDNDGKREVFVGLEDGWVCAFGADGAPLWQHRFSSGVRALAALEKSLAVGDRSGRISLMSATGTITRAAQMDGGIAGLVGARTPGQRDCFLLAATGKGELARFDGGE
ncbi:MAG: hypothetical protein JXR37_00345 [Kiritimatiellae bacterium]|nr:hypothetical protein [Kiritimatiellia bacterium]